jgi:hypothetical protein
MVLTLVNYMRQFLVIAHVTNIGTADRTLHPRRRRVFNLNYSRLLTRVTLFAEGAKLAPHHGGLIPPIGVFNNWPTESANKSSFNN